MRIPYRYPALLIILLSALMFAPSCEEDDDFVNEPLNYVTFASVDSVSVTEPVAISADIKEFAGKQINSIEFYVIKNSELYTERLSQEAAFTTKTNGAFFNNLLTVTYLGEKSNNDFAVNFDQYTCAINFPASAYTLEVGDYINVGLAVKSTDGSIAIKAKSIKIVE